MSSSSRSDFASGNIGSLDAGFIAIALIATAFVGYSEELLTRCLLIRGARGSGYLQIGVFLISSVTFGLIHGLNIINGQAIGITVMQIITTAFFGGYLYVTLRKGGYLIPLMVLHALFDFSLLTQGRVVNTTTMIIAAFINYGMMILLLLAIRTFSVRNHERGTDETGIPVGFASRAGSPPLPSLRQGEGTGRTDADGRFNTP